MYGLKAQKLLAQSNGYKQHALKGQKLLAQSKGEPATATSLAENSPICTLFLSTCFIFP